MAATLAVSAYSLASRTSRPARPIVRVQQRIVDQRAATRRDLIGWQRLAVAVVVEGERDVPVLGELAGAVLGVITQTIALVRHQHRRALAVVAVVDGDLADQAQPVARILDVCDVHRASSSQVVAIHRGLAFPIGRPATIFVRARSRGRIGAVGDAVAAFDEEPALGLVGREGDGAVVRDGCFVGASEAGEQLAAGDVERARSCRGRGRRSLRGPAPGPRARPGRRRGSGRRPASV